MFVAMRIALLSCGPSASTYGANDGDYDAVIGINKIVGKYRCDYWCFGDASVFRDVGPIGSPILCTDDATVFYVTHNFKRDLRRQRLIRWEALPNPLPDDQHFCFSSCAALALVERLGATSVDIYGADMTGERDYEGGDQSCRTPERWERERLRWDCLISWLTNGGIQCRIFRDNSTPVTST